jgi:hypothetical protein
MNGGVDLQLEPRLLLAKVRFVFAVASDEIHLFYCCCVFDFR